LQNHASEPQILHEGVELWRIDKIIEQAITRGAIRQNVQVICQASTFWIPLEECFIEGGNVCGIASASVQIFGTIEEVIGHDFELRLDIQTLDLSLVNPVLVVS